MHWITWPGHPVEPDAADALNNTGTILEAIGRLPEATPYFERAVTLRSDMLEFHLNLASNLLTRGEFARGWNEFEWRRMDPHQSASRIFDKPAWDGSDPAGRTDSDPCGVAVEPVDYVFAISAAAAEFGCEGDI